MKLAVVGSGIFGCTIALHAVRAGHEVHIFDKSPEIMSGASGANQFRLHKGYHYPRSPETAQECQAGLDSFRKEYPDAIVGGDRHIYAIAKNDSKTSFDQYRTFCEQQGLFYSEARPSHLDFERIEGAISVDEERIDHFALKRRLASNVAWVRTHFGTEIDGKKLRREFDKIVVAAYAGTNSVLEELGCEPREYQYEVCEKPVVLMPDDFEGRGYVIMDGPFGCIDPVGGPGFNLHVMGHVEHAIHHRNVGTHPEMPKEIVPLLGRGIIGQDEAHRAGSKYLRMSAALARFIPAVNRARHIGSMFTARTVLPNKDATDERPTIVEEIDNQVIKVFSGKIPTCVSAAKQVVSLLS